MLRRTGCLNNNCGWPVLQDPLSCEKVKQQQVQQQQQTQQQVQVQASDVGASVLLFVA
jgi:peptide methionine sulfoxide reductase MsrB